MPTLPEMGLITPVAGADSGSWDDKINAAFVLVDAHDHTSGKGVAVPIAGLDIDDDFPMAGFGLVNLGKISFSPIAAPSSGSKNLFVNASDNELYWRSNAGVNVKLTSGTSINTSLVGGIVGDYTSVSAEVAFDDANDRYTFKQNSATGWARLASGDVRLYETGTSESVYVGLKAPAALAVSYDITWPADPNPLADGVTHLMQMSSTGAVSVSNTLAAAIVAADFKHSTARVMVLGPGAFQQIGSTHVFNGTNWTLGNSSTATLWADIPLDVGDRITSIKLLIDKNSDGTNTLTADVLRVNVGAGATNIGTETNNANNPGNITLGTLTASETIATQKPIMIELSQSDSSPSANDVLYGVEVTYDRPA